MNNLQKFKDMVEFYLEILNNTDINNIEDFEINAIMGVTIELNTMIFTIKEFTDLTEHTMEQYVYSETGLTLDDLKQLENSFY